MDRGAWWAAVHGVVKSWTRLSHFTFTFHFHALEKEMAACSSVLAWRIPGLGEPGGLPTMGSHSQTRLKRLSSSSSSSSVLILACCDSWGRKESDTTERLNCTELKDLPTHSCLENSTDRRARWATVCGVTKSQAQLNITCSTFTSF